MIAPNFGRTAVGVGVDCYRYIYGAGNQPIEQINSKNEALYLHHDQAGSTRLMTGSTGKTEATFTYDAYGNQTGHTGTATSPLGFDGQLTSSDTGLIYLRAQVYDPATAQFLTVDPLVPLTRAPYNYANDNPINRMDRNGLCSILPESSESCFSEAPGAIASGAESIAQNPAEAGGIALGRYRAWNRHWRGRHWRNRSRRGSARRSLGGIRWGRDRPRFYWVCWRKRSLVRWGWGWCHRHRGRWSCGSRSCYRYDCRRNYSDQHRRERHSCSG
jgi:RHS repeat-associated protein